MTTELIDGKKIAARIKEDLKKEAEELKAKGIHPVLAAVLVGEDPASKKYIASKEKTCEAIGINSIGYKLPKSASQKEIIELVDTLNADSRVNGILVQLPLPKGLNEKEIMSRISPDKDVDGIGPHALGRLVLDDPGFIPCTPHGVMKMIEAYNITPYGKHAVIVGRSVIVGKPLALLLLRKNATVTMCHSKTSNLKEECLRADILCVAVGKAEMITGDMVKEGAVVIDIGVNVTSDGKLVGDVDFDTAKERAAYITPVPGGAGPMTIAMLMYNTVLAAKMRCS